MRVDVLSLSAEFEKDRVFAEQADVPRRRVFGRAAAHYATARRRSMV